MSGKAKTADRKGKAPAPAAKVEKVLEFRRNAKGNLAPKLSFRKVGA